MVLASITNPVKRKLQMNDIKHSIALLLAFCLLASFCNERKVQKPGDEALVVKAQAIHERVISIDTHIDIEVSFITPEFYRGRQPEKLVTLPLMTEGGLDAAFFAVFSAQGPRTKEHYEKINQEALEKIGEIQRAVQEVYPDQIELALHPEDVPRIHATGKKAAMIGMENGYPIGGDLAKLEEFHKLGCRYITLCHNGHNQICDSQANYGGPASEHDGVSEFGKKVIVEMNRLGLIIDISHMSKKSMLDTAKLSRAPVIASHSSCRELCDVARNLDDEQLLALKENGGVIHIVGFSEFIRSDPPEKVRALEDLRQEFHFPDEEEAFEKAVEEAPEDVKRSFLRRAEKIASRFPPASVKDLADHIDHAVALIGIDHVGLSSDFYQSRFSLKGWKDAGETFNITLELVRRGYTEEQIAKIWGGNCLRLWKEVEETSEKITPHIISRGD